MHENTVHGRKVKKLRLGKKKKNNFEIQTCVWEAQNALPKRTLSAQEGTNLPKGAAIVWNLDYGNIILESDIALAIKLFANSEDPYVDLSTFVYDCRELSDR